MASRQKIFKGNKHARYFPRIETGMFTWTILHQLLEKKLKTCLVLLLCIAYSQSQKGMQSRKNVQVKY
jgi:hypothetical protein